MVSDTNAGRSTPFDYSDDYATCAETYATLRVYTGKIQPEHVTSDLRLSPSKLLRESNDGVHLNGWVLSSKGAVDSLDVRLHVDWLLERIFNRRSELLALQSHPDMWMDIFCYWRSKDGHGGPSLSPKQMKALAELNLTIGFDCY